MVKENMLSLQDIRKLPEPEQSIRFHERMLEWDIEYWGTFVKQYENGEVQKTCADKHIEEYDKCLRNLHHAKEKHNSLIEKHAEYFL